MRYLYVAPRFHTNQVPIVSELIRTGNEVKFISQFAGQTEDYSDVAPVIVGYSGFFNLILFVAGRIGLLEDSKLNIFKIKCGFPNKHKLMEEISQFNPDVVITRERSVYSMYVNSICRRLGVSVILYDQSPYWLEKIKNDIPHKMVRKLTPNRRMTPVLGTYSNDKVYEPKSKYVPFVMPVNYGFEDRKSRERGNDRIRLIEIGKYENRKNHILMVMSAVTLMKEYDIELVIIGECSSDTHQKYYDMLETKIGELSKQRPYIKDRIHLLANVPYQDMEKEYKKADIMVIPSTAEPASISQLEAMSYSLPVICSEKNGTACYVENGVNGFLFKDNDEESLTDAIGRIIASKNMRNDMSYNSYRLVKEKYQIDLYEKGVKELISL